MGIPRLRIAGRLLAGLISITTILAIAVMLTVFMLRGMSQTVDRMVNLRTPAALASTQVTTQIHASLATLRAYLLTGNPQSKIERAAKWSELDLSIAALDKMAARFTNQDNKHKWVEAKALLGELRAAQDKAEAIAFTSEAFPATQLLVKEAAPRGAAMFAQITKMIDEEAGLDATPERKQLLKAMADTRGNFTAALAQFRMYLMTGDKEDYSRFTALIANFQKGFAAIKGDMSLLSASQRKTFESFMKTYEEFAPLSERMFAIRGSDKWNMPVYVLTTEAVPRVVKVLDRLDGVKQADGTYSGGIKTSQLQMLEEEAHGVEDGMSWLIKSQWALLAISLGMASLIALLTTRSIVPPLRSMTAMMSRLAAGEMSVAIPGVGKHDEIGEMAGAVVIFRDQMIEAEELRKEQAAMEQRAAIQRKAEMNKIADEFQAAVGEIVDSVSSASTELEASAGTLMMTAEHTQKLSMVVSSASEEASVNVQTVASASEELAGSVSEIARQVRESSRIADDAVRQVQRTDAQVGELSQAAGRISDVVKLITEIAEQTNLLALNATIEAARAGESGRGFAVVASEVKALAAQTAKATEEIGTQVTRVQIATKESVGAIQEISGTISKIAEISSGIAAAVEEQGAATQEIARAVQQAAQGTSEVASNIVGVNHGASETESASTEVLSAAKSLASESTRLKSDVSNFLNNVRAA